VWADSAWVIPTFATKFLINQIYDIIWEINSVIYHILNQWINIVRNKTNYSWEKGPFMDKSEKNILIKKMSNEASLTLMRCAKYHLIVKIDSKEMRKKINNGSIV